MIVTCVKVQVKPDRIEDFKKATMANHNESVKEPGNLRFDLLQDAKEPDQFLIYEAYESDEAAAAHKTTPHYAKWRDTVADWMAQPRQGIKYNIVVPSDKSKW
jgi:autoinducer 2-degrading protein